MSGLNARHLDDERAEIAAADLEKAEELQSTYAWLTVVELVDLRLGRAFEWARLAKAAADRARAVR